MTQCFQQGYLWDLNRAVQFVDVLIILTVLLKDTIGKQYNKYKHGEVIETLINIAVIIETTMSQASFRRRCNDYRKCIAEEISARVMSRVGIK